MKSLTFGRTLDFHMLRHRSSLIISPSVNGLTSACCCCRRWWYTDFAACMSSLLWGQTRVSEHVSIGRRTHNMSHATSWVMICRMYSSSQWFSSAWMSNDTFASATTRMLSWWSIFVLLPLYIHSSLTGLILVLSPTIKKILVTEKHLYLQRGSSIPMRPLIHLSRR